MFIFEISGRFFEMSKQEDRKEEEATNEAKGWKRRESNSKGGKRRTDD